MSTNCNPKFDFVDLTCFSDIICQIFIHKSSCIDEIFYSYDSINLSINFRNVSREKLSNPESLARCCSSAVGLRSRAREIICPLHLIYETCEKFMQSVII